MYGIILPEDFYDMYEEFLEEANDEKKTSENQCEYIVKKLIGMNIKCHNKAMINSKYCKTHSTTKCWCGSNATHNCQEVGHCDQALCNNSFCTTEHNCQNHQND